MMKFLFKAIAAAAVAAALFGCSAVAQKQELLDGQRIAMAMFQDRCNKAGEFIHRTVDNVEGIYLLKIRPRDIDYGNQFALDDPYGHDLGGDGYIESFLRGSYQANTSGTPAAGSPPAPVGYLYVEALDEKDRVRYRYTGRLEEPWQTNKAYLQGYVRFSVVRAPSPGAAPRYGVTYQDISTREEREYWIAGSSLKVIDLRTNEVIAERIGYMLDVFQGSQAGGRSPWLLAADHACPTFQLNPRLPATHGAVGQLRQTQRFVEKVLKPSATEHTRRTSEGVQHD